MNPPLENRPFYSKYQFVRNETSQDSKNAKINNHTLQQVCTLETCFDFLIDTAHLTQFQTNKMLQMQANTILRLRFSTNTILMLEEKKVCDALSIIIKTYDRIKDTTISVSKLAISGPRLGRHCWISWRITRPLSRILMLCHGKRACKELKAPRNTRRNISVH